MACSRPRSRVAALVGILLIVSAACTTMENGPDAAVGENQPGATSSETAQPSAPPATCEQITRFAEAIRFTGITRDYTPSTSPADLAQHSDLVVLGTTTGEVEVDPGAFEGASQVVISVRVSEVLRSTLLVPSEPTIQVRMLWGGGGRFTDRTVGAALEGIPVVAFLATWGGGLTTQIEGLVTACEAPGLLGLTGYLGEWATMTSLADVARAVKAGPTG